MQKMVGNFATSRILGIESGRMAQSAQPGTPARVRTYTESSRRGQPSGDAAGTTEPESSAEGIKERARSLAEATPPKLRLAFARSFCAATLGRYWEKLRPRCRQSLRAPPALPEPLVTLRREGLAVAEALAEAAAKLGVDAAGYLVGRTYAAMLPEDFRSENGVFYTPPAVVGRLLDSVTAAGVDWERCRALDPACGGGAFLGPVSRRMIAALKGADRRVVLRNLGTRLAGYEIDPFAAWISAVFLDATLNEEIGSAADESFAPIQVCDSLARADADGEFDLVIGNPPYGRVRLTAAQRLKYRRSLFGHANLYGLFLDLALRKAKPGGVIAYVTPTGFLCGEYFKNLRSLLGTEAPPLALDFITERAGVFDDVLQETLLAVFRKNSPQGPVRAQVNFVEVTPERSVAVTSAGEALLPEPAQEPWIVPRVPSATALVARLRTMPTRLADWGYGVSTGPLVWNRYKDRMRQKPVAGAVPLVWAEAVGADGGFSFRAARRNHAPYFVVHENEDFLLVRKPCVLLQRTTSKEQARRLVSAELSQAFLDEHGGAVTVENHLNMVVSTVPVPSVETAALAAFLNSAAADRVFRCISGTVAVSAYELEAMPLPPPWAMKGLSLLLSGSCTRAQVEEYCGRLYGER